MRSVSERIGSMHEFYQKYKDKINFNLRVAMPGIIQSFDPEEQTVTVQPAIREKIKDNDLVEHWVDLPLLLDVPIVLPRAGNFVLTMPIQKGDECLIIFADSCIDAWFVSGGVQNWNDLRRHDLSDGFAILGAWSQPNIISNYSTTSTELRNLSGTQKIQVSDNEINLVGNVKVNGDLI